MHAREVIENAFGAHAHAGQIEFLHTRLNARVERVGPEQIIRGIGLGLHLQRRTDRGEVVQIGGEAGGVPAEEHLREGPMPGCAIDRRRLPRRCGGKRQRRPGGFIERFAVIVPHRFEHAEHVRTVRGLSVREELPLVRVSGIEIGVDLVPVIRARRYQLIEAGAIDRRDIFCERRLHAIVERDDHGTFGDQREDRRIGLDRIVPDHRPRAVRTHDRRHAVDVRGKRLRRARRAAAAEIERLVGADVKERRRTNRGHLGAQ